MTTLAIGEGAYHPPERRRKSHHQGKRRGRSHHIDDRRGKQRSQEWSRRRQSVRRILMRLLIPGGENDPNITHPLEIARKRKIKTSKILFGSHTRPSIHWYIHANRLLLDGTELESASVFLRYDVFNHMTDARVQTAFRAHAWYAAIAGWIASRADIRTFNRDGEPYVSKPA